VLTLRLISVALSMPHHIEFLDRDHFYSRYHRKKAGQSISKFIDFFWETDFDGIFINYPEGFTDMLFPDVGYTYLINLGTPFTMQLDDDVFEIKRDAFLPRYKNVTARHYAGNKIFGIKFKVSPVIFEKKVNFSEYTSYIFPLAYLIDGNIVEKVKQAATFQKRIEILSTYYEKIISKYSGSLKHVDMVTDILKSSFDNNFKESIEDLAGHYNLSTRTLQRYFEGTTGISTKQALQIMRIRKSVSAYVQSHDAFEPTTFGYFDYSHFYKHINQFLSSHKGANIHSHLQLLQGSGLINY
jgi:AraC-like DNA-binding protein